MKNGQKIKYVGKTNYRIDITHRDQKYSDLYDITTGTYLYL
jgi:hypothetical protein